MKNILLALLLIFLSQTWLLKSQEVNNETEPSDVEEEHISAYHAGIFLGATTNFEHKATDFTLGLDYEYRLPYLDHTFGAGFILEGVFAEHKESILAIPIFIHPGFWHLKFCLAPGVEFGDEVVKTSPTEIFIKDNKRDKILSETDPNAKTEFNSHFLFRIGMGYDYHIDIFSISPSVSLDFVNGTTALVYGFTFGMSL